MNSDIIICGTRAEPKSRTRGILWVGPYFYPPYNAKIRKYVRIPFTVIRGAGEGPTFCVNAGIHPTEYCHIAAAIRLSNEIAPEDLLGTLFVIPVVNIPGFEQREYINPIDGKNLQGNWPGKTEIEGGTISHLILHEVFNQLVSKADYYMDLHGADVHETVVPYSGYYRTGKTEIDEKSEGMARATGVKYIHFSKGLEGVGSATRVAAERGIPAAAFEAGSGDQMLPEEVEKSFKSLLNVMRYLKIIGGEPIRTEGQILTEQVATRVQHFGLFYRNPELKLGEYVAEGQVLGKVRDVLGDAIETVRAPIAGYLILWMHNPVVEPGERIVMIQRPRAE